MTNDPTLNHPNHSGVQDLNESMHIKFRRSLIVNYLAGRVPRYHSGRWQWLVRKIHIEKFLDEYQANNNALPTGCHDLGTTEKFNIELGIVDFDKVNRNMIINHQKKQNDIFCNEHEVMMSQIYWEMFIGMREQNRGRNPNDAISLMRQRSVEIAMQRNKTDDMKD